MENYALFSLPSIFTTFLYAYALVNILYLGEPSGNSFWNSYGAFIHIFIHGYYHIYQKENYQIVFFCQCYRFIFRCSFFLVNVTSRTLSFFTSLNLSQVDIIKFSKVLSSTSQPPPKFYSLLNKEKTSAKTETKLDFISFIWDDDLTETLMI